MTDHEPGNASGNASGNDPGDPADAADLRFESEHELVAVKPAGRSCELPGEADRRSWRAELERTLGERLRLCHRLDRIARGLVLLARSGPAAAFHAERIRSGHLLKGYLVRVDGLLDRHLLGVHRAYLRRRGRRAELVRSGGDPAVLELIETAAAPDRPGQSHVAVRLETGRFHQIRAMLASLGHPLAGDTLYGGSAPVDDDGPTPWLESAVLGFRPFGADRDLVVRARPAPGMAFVDERVERALARLGEEHATISERRDVGGSAPHPPSTPDRPPPSRGD